MRLIGGSDNPLCLAASRQGVCSCHNGSWKAQPRKPNMNAPVRMWLGRPGNVKCRLLPQQQQSRIQQGLSGRRGVSQTTATRAITLNVGKGGRDSEVGKSCVNNCLRTLRGLKERHDVFIANKVQDGEQAIGNYDGARAVFEENGIMIKPTIHRQRMGATWPASEGKVMSQWYYTENREQRGPVSEERLKQLASSGNSSHRTWFGSRALPCGFPRSNG